MGIAPSAHTTSRLPEFHYTEGNASMSITVSLPTPECALAFVLISAVTPLWLDKACEETLVAASQVGTRRCITGTEEELWRVALGLLECVALLEEGTHPLARGTDKAGVSLMIAAARYVHDMLASELAIFDVSDPSDCDDETDD